MQPEKHINEIENVELILLIPNLSCTIDLFLLEN